MGTVHGHELVNQFRMLLCDTPAGKEREREREREREGGGRKEGGKKRTKREGEREERVVEWSKGGEGGTKEGEGERDGGGRGRERGSLTRQQLLPSHVRPAHRRCGPGQG